MGTTPRQMCCTHSGCECEYPDPMPVVLGRHYGGPDRPRSQGPAGGPALLLARHHPRQAGRQGRGGLCTLRTSTSSTRRRARSSTSFISRARRRGAARRQREGGVDGRVAIAHPQGDGTAAHRSAVHAIPVEAHEDDEAPPEHARLRPERALALPGPPPRGLIRRGRSSRASLRPAVCSWLLKTAVKAQGGGGAL